MRVSLVPAAYLDDIWAEVGSMLEPAVAVTNGRYTVDDVRRLLMQDHMTLWIAFDEIGIRGCEITRIIDYPSKRVLCSVFTAGQHLRHWREPMMAVLLKWANDVGCSAIEGQGRPGWVKLLEPYGCKPMMMTFEKDV